MTTGTAINPHKIDFAKIPLSNEQRIVAALENIEKMMRAYIAAQQKPTYAPKGTTRAKI